MKVKIDRKSECKYCRRCHKNFNHTDNKPCCLIPCGHTFCIECTSLHEFKEERTCPTCRERFNQVIPDYEMIDMLNSLVKLSVGISDEEDTKRTDSDEESETNKEKAKNTQPIEIANNQHVSFIYK
jgi:hypothetical protein